MKLEEIRAMLAEITPGPWKYDMGNWEVEGPRPERHTICSMTPDDRHSGFGENSPQNPVSSMADGAFIAMARELMPKLLAVAEAAQKLLGDPRLDGDELRAALAAVLEAP